MEDADCGSRRHLGQDFISRNGYHVQVRFGVPKQSVGRRLVVFMVARGRVQLPTFALGVRCSMHLSYRATDD